MKQQLISAFYSRFNEMPAFIVRAPGRINLMGEHTDYNEGFVLPMAIDKALWIAFRPRYDRQLILHALDLGETGAFRLDQFDKGAGWLEYVKGMVWAFASEAYQLLGWEGVIVSDIPIGAGLSSSAALLLGVARTFSAISRWAWQPARMAALAQKAENEWVGVNCGIMDQLICAAGQAGNALLIDCRSNQFAPVPLPAPAAILILDTGVRRALVGSAYNDRQRHCQTAADIFAAPALRDVTMAQFQVRQAELDETIRRRARHVITENERVIQASQAMRQNDVHKIGALMSASHASLRDDFEVSGEALDAVVAIANRQSGCLGARMTGAGFGGCAIALVDTQRADQIGEEIAQQYRRQTGLEAAIYRCQPSDGVQLIEVK